MLKKIVSTVRKTIARTRGDVVSLPAPDVKTTEEEESSKAASAAATPPKRRRPRRRKRRRRSQGSPPAGQDGRAKANVAARPATDAGDPLHWDPSSFVVPVVAGKTRFHDLNLPNEILHAIAEIGFQYCTPIQAEILPSTLAGKDATGRAQTGTGKTAAFAITLLSTMLRREPPPKRKRHGAPRALVLAPTRELVLQIVADVERLGAFCNVVVLGVLGGVDYDKQRRQLTDQQVDLVVATPGRLLDFYRQRCIHLDQVEMLVIDEADRMLDMGFIPDVRTIVYATPPKDRRQTLLFSATLTEEVTRLAGQWTREPVVVEIEPEQVVTDTVEQLVYLVTSKEKYALTYNIITGKNLQRVIIFCNRRDETRHLAGWLQRYGLNCAILSGEVPQNKRLRTLENFKNGTIRVLVATDVAGRGIHIEGISHVINFTLPYEPEDYVHRIGRTGRAGHSGTSVSFADEADSFYLPDIEEFIGTKLHCIHPDPDMLKLPKPRPQTGGKGGSRDGQRQQAHGAGSRKPRRRRGPRRRGRKSAPAPPKKTAGDA